MVTPELENYIKQARTQGLSDAQIRQNLLSQGGWNEGDLNEAFGVPPSYIPPLPHTPNPTNYVEKKSHLGLIISVVVVVLLLLGGWYFFSQSNQESAENQPAAPGDFSAGFNIPSSDSTPAPEPATIPAPADSSANDLSGSPGVPGGKLCETPLAASVLVQALPATLTGYESIGAPSLQNFPDRSLAQATFTKYINDSEPDRGVSIAITDQCADQSAAWNAIFRNSELGSVLKIETTTVAGNQATKTSWKSENRFDYKVLVGNRAYVIAVGNTGTPEADVLAAANAVDYAKLKELQK